MYDEDDKPIVEKEEMVSRFPTNREKEIILDIERKAMKVAKLLIDRGIRSRDKLK